MNLQEIDHQIDQNVINSFTPLTRVFATSATVARQDQVLQIQRYGLDQTDFFLGKQGHSNRDSLITFLGDEIVAVRWKHFRLYPRQFIETQGIPPMTGIVGARTETNLYPIVINLFADHKRGTQYYRRPCVRQLPAYATGGNAAFWPIERATGI